MCQMNISEHKNTKGGQKFTFSCHGSLHT